MGMCFAAESDVQAFIAYLLCMFLIFAALVAQVNQFAFLSQLWFSFLFLPPNPPLLPNSPEEETSRQE